jgi:hypothetical protein
MILLFRAFVAEAQFVRTRLPVKQNYLYGVIDTLGNLIVAPTYQYLKGFEYNNYALVRKAEKWGIINEHGTEIHTCSYDWIDFPEFGNNEKFVAQKDSKQGVITFSGQILLPFVYDRIELLSKTYFAIYQNGKAGIADSSGKIIISPQFDRVALFTDLYNFSDKSIVYPNGTLFKTYKNNHIGLTNAKQNISFSPEYEAIKAVAENETIYFILTKNNKKTITNLDAEILFPFEYDNIVPIDKQGIVKIIAGNKTGIFSVFANQMLLPVEAYKDVTYNSIIKEITVQSNDGSTIKIDAKGENITTTEQLFENGWKVKSYKGKLIFSRGTNQDTIVGQSAQYLNDQLCAVIFSDKRAKIYHFQKKTFTIPHSFESVKYWKETNTVLVKNGENFGLLDQNGALILSCKYKAIRNIGYGLFAFQQENTWGLVDSQGKIVIPATYTGIASFKDGMRVTRVRTAQNKYGLINTKGKIVATPQYDTLRLFKESAKAYQQNKVTVYEFDTNGNLTDSYTFQHVKTLQLGEKEINLSETDGAFNEQKTLTNLQQKLTENTDRTQIGDWYKDKNTQKWGYKNGKNTIPPIFTHLTDWTENILSATILPDSTADKTEEKILAISHHKDTFKTAHIAKTYIFRCNDAKKLTVLPRIKKVVLDTAYQLLFINEIFVFNAVKGIYICNVPSLGYYNKDTASGLFVMQSSTTSYETFRFTIIDSAKTRVLLSKEAVHFSVKDFAYADVARMIRKSGKNNYITVLTDKKGKEYTTINKGKSKSNKIVYVGNFNKEGIAPINVGGILQKTTTQQRTHIDRIGRHGRRLLRRQMGLHRQKRYYQNNTAIRTCKIYAARLCSRTNAQWRLGRNF